MTIAEKFNRKIGLEIEVSEDNYYATKPALFWHKGVDGSVLRCGREYKFLQPLQNVNFIKAVDMLCQHFNENTSKIKFRNVNAGFHIHIDYKDKFDKALKFADLAYCLEDWMFNTVNKERQQNSYCIRLGEPPSEYYNKLLSQYTTRHQALCNMRRKWIHVASMAKHGSVEIRLHHSTNDKMEILTWCEFWTSLAELSDNSDNFVIPEDKEQLLQMMNLTEPTYNRFSQSLKKWDNA